MFENPKILFYKNLCENKRLPISGDVVPQDEKVPYWEKYYSPVAKHTNTKMFFTAGFFYGNVMYMVWRVRKCRMLICILLAI